MAVVGWDIGGAHLKAARCEGGRIAATAQVAAPLRLGLERLAQAFAEVKALIGSADCQVVTMTGELADTFSSRAEGVASLTAAAVRELAPSHVMVYAGRAGFVAPADAAKHVTDIASANWFASASVVSKWIGSSLFMDMGSTTTDIVPIVKGVVAACGYTDAERLANGELVYTGLVRSFLMATANRVPFAGGWTEMIHENFANMADVHRILGNLPDGADQMASADGRAKTLLRRGRGWRASLDAICRCRYVRMDSIGAIFCRSSNSRRYRRWYAGAVARRLRQTRQSSSPASVQACCERWLGAFPATASISMPWST